MTDHPLPTREDVDSYLRDRRNWGRCGDAGAAGAMNLIDNAKRLRAVSLVKTGRTVSLSRPFPVLPSAENPRPAVQFLMKGDRPPGGGAATEYFGVAYHGTSTTHIDALCHVWDENGGWDGRDPNENVLFNGVQYGTVDEWSNGILTRGVLLDVPKHRGVSHVTLDAPVHGWELEEIAVAQGVKLEPGDAVCVYSGQEKFAALDERSGTSWPPCILPAIYPRQRYVSAFVGHDGCITERVRRAMDCPRRHFCLRCRTGGQLAARTACECVR